MNGLALCAGIGGMELGLKLALRDTYQTVGYIEREAYAASVLVARMEDETLDQAPIWDDIKTFPGELYSGKVDLISAGFPCQPFSTASRGRKTAENLWPAVFDIIRQQEPRFVFLENVQAAPIDAAKSDLRLWGYRCKTTQLSAAQLGAAQRRTRHWLLADTNSNCELPFKLNAETPSAPAPENSPWRTLGSEILGMDDGVS